MKTKMFRLPWALVAVVVSIMTAGIGFASASGDPLIGKTYAEAAQRVTQWRLQPAISTVIGSVLKTDECIVTSWRKSSYVSRDHFDHQDQVLLSLDCNPPLASAKSPGGSLASPEGRAYKEIADQAERLNNNPDRCVGSKGCKAFCDAYPGMCSDEVMAAIA